MIPKITVLMPVYNAEKFLREAIDSILNQTFKDFEFLIINDASTDGTEKIILSYKDPRIRYFKNQKNLGVARTLNKGLKLAKAELIARMDADDISLPERLETEYRVMLNEQDLVLLASNFERIDKDGKYLSTEHKVILPEEIYYTLQFRNYLGHPTVMYKKKTVLEEFKGYKIQESEDYDLWLRISKKYKIEEINKVLVKIRRSKQSRTVMFSNEVKEAEVKTAHGNLEQLLGRPIPLKIAYILVGNYDYNCYSPEVKVAGSYLGEINRKILRTCPGCCDKKIIEKLINNNNRKFKTYLFANNLLNSRFKLIFTKLFKVYLKFKYSTIKRLQGLEIN